jgi:dynein heavy chain 1
MSKETRRVGRDELKGLLGARLSVFYEEELDGPLVIFDEVLEHILRIDRVLRQPMGHCLLVGDSGAGKTVLSKFVSWMNGLSIFQIKAHSKYDLNDFNEDLRSVMRRVGVEGEKICFIFDESNALGSGFLEAMNALLASGEVPGLFEGDDYTALINAFRDSSNRNGMIVDNEEELWRRFTAIVQRNLHVVFTMNPSGGEWKNRSTTSPALFNRCVVDWFGTWSPKAMGEVGKEFTMTLDMGDAESVGGSWGIGDGQAIMNEVASVFEGAASGGLRQAVVAALVDIHKTAKDMSDECANSSNTTRTYMSPRDYLALIHNFVSSVRKMREQVEDEQLHVNAGLAKLRQTQENVADLKVALSAKTSELRQKEDLANEKLQQMVGDQNKAEKRKEEAEKTSAEVEKQSTQITLRKEEAQRDLDQAEPALRGAQAAVKDIRKRDLDEIRNLLRPPPRVRATLECIAIMLGETDLEWTNVRKLVSKTEFIPSILDFAADTLSARQVKLVTDRYLDGNDDLSYEVVLRASQACGPLYKWAESQVKYSSVFNRVQPLRDEVARLEQESASAIERQQTLESEVAKLQTSIVQYKADYATLIRDVESLKGEMVVVTKKVNRAESLINSLSKESERWSKSSEGFELILRNLVGDGLLMAAFLTYSGFFDFKARLILTKRWQKVIDLLGIEFRPNLSMVEVLSKAADRLNWQSQGLPSDSLSIENGVILDHCVRFPLIIDPSGHAIDFIMNKFKNEKIQKTSFLDNAFMKTLAGAVRFGTTLLVENVEHIDPVLNPLLNKEIQRTGGRALVRIGTEDVDYSPKFNIILTTKNPAARLTPDICSRVTMINFTVTPASLHSQSLSLILKTEKPEIEEQRINLLKLQGEQQVKLRELEEQMLSKISAVEGSILDDDNVVDGMEFLMKEGPQVDVSVLSVKRGRRWATAS